MSARVRIHNMASSTRAVVDALVSDLRAVFADRLESVVVFGRPAEDDAQQAGQLVHTLAVVTQLGIADLEGCARRSAAWRRARLATPLLIDADEFARSLDAFPIEFGAILARYDVVSGSDPFAGRRVHHDDLRRACEVQVRSHLLHLREGFVEAGADPAGIARLVSSSAAPLATLLTNLALLAGSSPSTRDELAGYAATITGAPPGVFEEVMSGLGGSALPGDAARVFPAYLSAMRQLADYVDRWSTSG
jgi:hypothetical protein